MTSPSAAEVRGLRRTLASYEACKANPIASGSKAQMMYFIEDAKADIATLATALEASQAEVERLKQERDALKLEAQIHAGEARAANSTIYEIYQVLSGSTGEPGNWNGAEPARQYVTAAQERIAVLEGALEPFADTFRQHNDPGVSDLYNEQPVAWHVPLGAYRVAATLSPAVKEPTDV